MALIFMKGKTMQDNKNHVTENTQAVMFSKTIGKTTYDVSVYHNNANQETLHSKVLRLMQNDLAHKSL